MSLFTSDEEKEDLEEFNIIMEENKKYGVYHKATDSGALYIEGDINNHPNIIKARKGLDKLFN